MYICRYRIKKVFIFNNIKRRCRFREERFVFDLFYNLRETYWDRNYKVISRTTDCRKFIAMNIYLIEVVV